MVILVYDLKHKIIPDKIVYPLIAIAFGSLLYRFFTIDSFHLLKSVAEGIIVALPFFLLWFLSKGRFMGFGDVKLALAIGWLVGISSGFAVLIMSFWIGGLVGIFLMAISRKYKMDSQIPFAPFLILALFVVGLWGLNIQNLFPLW
jgi:leader peptidase (prepilin peptidase)/N-methyltransferase